MAGLIERLMGLNANGTVPTSGNPDRPRIPVNIFFAAANELDQGGMTVQNVKDAFGMNAAEQTEFDAYAALRPTGTTATALANRARWISRQHSILLLADSRNRYSVSGYTTPAEIRSKIGL